ncbi:uncharacterized protein V6R79_012035 [Siganus canaliculatus]
MAETDQSLVSLMSLEDELTCSICLNTFDCPVTIPCGHNFCQDCLLDAWTEDSYSCPQCRTVFDSKPELKKNTVLSTVVETFRLKSETCLLTEDNDEEKDNVVLCDTCMEAEASQTCLTCMASFCEEHLRPHRENPKFTVHQLIDPVGDLSEHICPEHHKMMEFFCSQHERSICSICLQQVHKGCSFMSPEEQRNLKESNLRDKLGLLDGKIDKTDTVIFQMTTMQSKLKETATQRKSAMSAVYQQMHELLVQEEREALLGLDHELETGQTKLRDLMKRLAENSESMKKAREDINSLLSQSQSPAFLQSSLDLPRAVKFDPYTPRIHLDSKKVIATQAFTAGLKEYLTELLKQPVEARLLKLKPDGKAACDSGSAELGPSDPPPPTYQPVQPHFQPVHVPVFIAPQGSWKPPQHTHAQNFYKGHPFTGGQKTHKKSDTGHHPTHNKKSDSGHQPSHHKKSETSHQPFHKQDKKTPGASGGDKPSGKGSDSAKKGNPKSHPQSGKSGGNYKK